MKSTCEARLSKAINIVVVESMSRALLHCRGVNAIVYVVDSSDSEALQTAKTELHDLLAKPALEGIPTLILGNKNDLPTAIGVDELIATLSLKSLANREVCCYSVSAKNSVNMDITMDWLIKHSKTAQ